MFSTRDIRRMTLSVVVAAALGVASVGCQSTWREAESINQTPILVDEAMEIRQWDETPAYYENGGVVAGPVTPFNLPTRQQTYRGARWEPTYTAQPPLNWSSGY